MIGHDALAEWIAGSLFAAVVVGWLLHVIWRWLTVATGPERARLAALSEDLHRSEERREHAQAQAEAARAEAEAAKAEVAALRARLERVEAGQEP
ncbi:MAG: hypothetical protein AAGI34_01955 [Pseudomonadota bacterium]